MAVTDPIAQRVVLNEALFKDVNKNIARVSSDGRHDEAHFICECGEKGCEDKIPLAIETYKTIRSNPLYFFVRPGHEIPRVESVIGRYDRYVVIEKPPEMRPIIDEIS